MVRARFQRFIFNKKPAFCSVVVIATLAVTTSGGAYADSFDEPGAYQVSYQYNSLDSYSTASSQRSPNQEWAWIAAGGAALLLLGLAAEDDAKGGASGPGQDPDGSPGSGEPIGQAPRATTSLGSDSSASSTKGRLFQEIPHNGLFFSFGETELDLKSSSQSASGESNEQQFTLGYDRRLSDKLTAGVLLDRAEAETTLDNSAGELDKTRVSVFGFFSYQLSQKTALYSYLGIDKLERDSSRAGNDLGQIKGSTDGTGFNVGVSLSHDFLLVKGFTSSLQFELDLANATYDAFTESGASADLLRVSEQEEKSLTFSVGGTLSKSLSLSQGVLVPQVGVKLSNEFESDAIDTDAVTVSDNTGETLSSSEKDKQFMVLTGSATLVIKNGIQLFANAEKYFQNDLFDRYRYSLGARMEF